MNNPKNKIKETNQLYKSNRIWYLEINLTNKAQDSYTKNYKTMLKENKKDPKN